MNICDAYVTMEGQIVFKCYRGKGHPGPHFAQAHDHSDSCAPIILMWPNYEETDRQFGDWAIDLVADIEGSQHD